MIKVDHIDVFNFHNAIRGMRNPKNSWDRMDSGYGCGLPAEACLSCEEEVCKDSQFYVGPNDLKLMQTLYKGGPVHAKYLRQIFVSMDIIAPLYWWKEFDTYMVGTAKNSCSTMHKIHSKEFDIDDFSSEHLNEQGVDLMCDIINYLNCNRLQFGNTNDKKYWWNMIQILPSSYNQKRTVTMNYQNVMNMLDWRTDHKLDEWREFCKILRELPYVEEIRSEK